MFSKTGLRILHQVSIGQDNLKEIAKAIKKSDKQIYRECKKLIDEGYIKLDRGKILPERQPHISLLLQVLREHDNVTGLFSGCGTLIFASLINKKSIGQICEETGLKKSIIYRKINQASNIGLIYKKDGYVLNEKLWPKALDFFQELDRVNKTVDRRVPATSEIFYKNNDEIVFSDNAKIDAAKTAFSVYNDYGIKLYLLTNYYYLPKKKLTKNDILLHSIYIAEKSGVREIIFVSLFYIKYKNKISIRHQMLEKIDRILMGEKIPGYPYLSEIKSRCDVYDIRI
ncbi:MAG: hypothetical protein V1859_05815 [archaeon]